MSSRSKSGNIPVLQSNGRLRAQKREGEMEPHFPWLGHFGLGLDFRRFLKDGPPGFGAGEVLR